MKTSHIALLIVLGLAISVILTSTGSTGQYANFSEAKSAPKEQYTVVGFLEKEVPIVYNPKVDANLTTFSMRDKEGVVMQVSLNAAKPQDFERSEEVVVKGSCREGVFYANTILLKCPSKYAEQNEFGENVSVETTL